MKPKSKAGKRPGKSARTLRPAVRAMAEKKRTISLFGQTSEVVDVPITKALENFNEYELEDGSVLRVKNVAGSILRVKDQYNVDGSPIYIVLATPVVNVVKSIISSGGA